MEVQKEYLNGFLRIIKFNSFRRLSSMNQLQSRLLKSTSFLLIFVILLMQFSYEKVTYAKASDQLESSSSFFTGQVTTDVGDSVASIPDYATYMSQHKNIGAASSQKVIDAETYNKSTGAAPLQTYYNYQGNIGASLLLPDSGSVDWSFTVDETGLYNISFLYYPFSGDGSPIVRDILIDGTIPFQESQNVVFDRIWGDQDNQNIKYDEKGNQILPVQVEKPRWMSKPAIDSSGYYDQPLNYYLTAGSHVLTLLSKREPMLLREITLYHEQTPKSYSEIETEYAKKGYNSVSDSAKIMIQAENANSKSDQTMYPLTDRTSPTVMPNNIALIHYNTIGGSQWKAVGQWLEWSIDVKESGLYNIAAHFKQALKSGDISIRELYIDGKLPFAEASNLSFPYANSWKLNDFSDENGNPYKFYLKAGPHTLRLRVGLGSNAEVLLDSQKYLQELNSIYRKIVVVTGTKPDMYRDYQFDKAISDTISDMKKLCEQLKALETKIKMLNRNGGQNTADIKRLYVQLDQMTEDTDTISYRLMNFKDNISSFGTWINGVIAQPLELDYLLLTSVNAKLPHGEAGIFGLLKYYFLQFFASFSMDYSSVGETAKKSTTTIRIWTTSGRDQAQVLKQLINSRLTPSKGIGVNLQLVAQNSLLPAILAHIGPDVSIGLVQADPLNMALRKGILDLSQFKDYKSIENRFYKSALIPFQLNGGLWALPETESFPMLFYRKDILKELGISVSDLNTWDSILKTVFPKLQKSSLSFGVPTNTNGFLTFLYQRGGNLYLNNGKESGLGTSEAISAMKEYTMLYTQYGLPLTYDFANRFRTGEIPVALADFTSYNQLTVFAPEIKGLWGMLPVPATVRQNGTLDRSTVGAFTGCVILSQTKQKKASWEFLKWWTSAETQTAYGKELESVVGSAARYNSANKESMRSVQWDYDVKDNIFKQVEFVEAFPEVPGGYFTSRLFDFAFRDIVYSKKDVRETVNDTVTDINQEIANKRKEYKMD